MKRFLVLALVLVAASFVATACGSSKKTVAAPTIPNLLPPAQTPDQWAKRIVDRFLRPMNSDLKIVNGFNNPDVIVFIANRNAATLRIVRARLADLSKCSARLVAIGPPPAGRAPLRQVNTKLLDACKNYVPLAQQLQKVTLFLSSGRSDVIAEGRKVLHSSIPTANAAGRDFAAAIKLAQQLPEFRRAGLRPSV